MPNGVAFFNPTMATPLHRECAALVNRGLHPISIVAYARALECPAMLETAFPSMPISTRIGLMDGTRALLLDQFFNWTIVIRDEQIPA